MLAAAPRSLGGPLLRPRQVCPTARVAFGQLRSVAQGGGPTTCIDSVNKAIEMPKPSLRHLQTCTETVSHPPPPFLRSATENAPGATKYRYQQPSRETPAASAPPLPHPNRTPWTDQAPGTAARDASYRRSPPPASRPSGYLRSNGAVSVPASASAGPHHQARSHPPPATPVPPPPPADS